MILSQVLRGMADVFRDLDGADGRAVADGLSGGREAAYGAVMRPVEGTILTVVREAAEARQPPRATARPLVDVLEAANDAAT